MVLSIKYLRLNSKPMYRGLIKTHNTTKFQKSKSSSENYGGKLKNSDLLLTILSNNSMTQSIKKVRSKSNTVLSFLNITLKFKNIQISSERYNLKMQKTQIMKQKKNMKEMIQSWGTNKKSWGMSKIKMKTFKKSSIKKKPKSLNCKFN